MEVLFRARKLEKEYCDHQRADKAYGSDVARRYIERINIIKAALDIEVLKRIPGLRCHELKGDRRGFWSVNLGGRYRLIFTLEGKRLEIVRIEEVSKHYDD